VLFVDLKELIGTGIKDIRFVKKANGFFHKIYKYRMRYKYKHLPEYSMRKCEWDWRERSCKVMKMNGYVCTVMIMAAAMNAAAQIASASFWTASDGSGGEHYRNSVQLGNAVHRSVTGIIRR